MATLLLVTSVTLSGCYYDSEEVLYPGSFCDLTDVTWTMSIEPIIATECAIPGCHVPGGDGPGDFTSYAGVREKAENGKIQQKVLVERSMPPTGALPNCELQKIAVWIQAGYPEN